MSKEPLCNERKLKPETLSEIWRFRVLSKDSAVVYHILEGHDGLCAYSTDPAKAGDLYRDMELIVPISQKIEMKRVLEVIKKELNGELHVYTEK